MRGSRSTFNMTNLQGTQICFFLFQSTEEGTKALDGKDSSQPEKKKEEDTRERVMDRRSSNDSPFETLVKMSSGKNPKTFSLPPELKCNTVFPGTVSGHWFFNFTVFLNISSIFFIVVVPILKTKIPNFHEIWRILRYITDQSFHNS